jgi:hypothetical protein
MLPYGFKQTETMKGYLRFLDSPDRERATRFDCEFAVIDWLAFLQTGETRLTGKFTSQDFVLEAPFEGKLFIDPFRSKKLVYEFPFDGPEGKRCVFYGEKRLEFLRFPQTITTLYSRLSLDDRVIATGILYFDLFDLPAFLLSLRPVKL